MCCEVGYVLSKFYWNQGIMTEALSAVINYLFKYVHFHRIQARYNIENPASGKVMKKCRMQYEGVLRESNKTNTGQWCDTVIYSILNGENINL